MLDRLSPAARSAVILMLLVPLVAAVGVLSAAVLAASGVLGVDWALTGRAVIDGWAVALVGGIGSWIALWITPLTRTMGPQAKADADTVAEP